MYGPEGNHAISALCFDFPRYNQSKTDEVGIMKTQLVFAWSWLNSFFRFSLAILYYWPCSSSSGLTCSLQYIPNLSLLVDSKFLWLIIIVNNNLWPQVLWFLCLCSFKQKTGIVLSSVLILIKLMWAVSQKIRKQMARKFFFFFSSNIPVVPLEAGTDLFPFG